MIDFLKQHRVLIVAGTGGVGKTTLSASLGVLAAKHSLKTLVLTIDPARRLAQALGLTDTGGQDVAVPGQANLRASMIDPRHEFDQFVLGSVDNVIARGLFDNKLYQQLASNLNGSQEFTSLVRLLGAAADDAYDLIILDTPPTQNAVDFLRAPERIYALFQDTVIGWFAGSGQERESWIKRTLNRGTRLVTSGLEAATGSGFIAELKDFFKHIGHLKGNIAAVSAGVKDLLHDPRTGFLLVTGFDETKLREALDFSADLDGEGLKLCGILVNRWFPEWSTEGAERDPAIAALYAQFKFHFSSREAAYNEFAAGLKPNVPVLKLPDLNQNVRGLADLERVAATIERSWTGKR